MEDLEGERVCLSVAGSGIQAWVGSVGFLYLSLSR